MIGYVCRHKTVDGSTKLREKYDISADDACDRKSIPAWHLDFMGLTIFPTILHDRRESIAASYDLIEQYYADNRENTDAAVAAIQKKLGQCDKKISKLFELFTNDTIGIEEYKAKRAGFDEEKRGLEGELREAEEKKAELEQQASDVRYDELIGSLSAVIDMFNFKGEKMSADFVRNYVDRIVVRSDHVYEWMVTLALKRCFLVGDILYIYGNQGLDALMTHLLAYFLLYFINLPVMLISLRFNSYTSFVNFLKIFSHLVAIFFPLW